MGNEIFIQTSERLRDKLYVIRGVQVMLDRDLAEIYGYTVKAFNQQVKNNIEKFEDDFRFQLTDDEVKMLSSCKDCTLNDIYNNYPRSRTLSLDDENNNRSRSKILTLNDEIDNLQPDILTSKRGSNIKYNHCGASSKDSGKKINSIIQIEDLNIYHKIIDDLLNNPQLTF